MTECAICRIINERNDIEKGYMIAELETGYAVISNKWQYFKGYTLFICKECVGELHDLPTEYRQKFLFEMSVVSEALYNVLKPKKLNYELLGNDCKHLHWHLIPRYGTDPLPQKAIWNISRDIFETTRLCADEIKTLRMDIRNEMFILSEKYGIKML